MAQKKPAYEAPAPADDKKKALETALHQIEKNYGEATRAPSCVWATVRR
mgnify:CR=1 FL=1